METPWGRLDVCDAHIHFFSHGFFSLLAKQKPGLHLDEIGAALGWQMPPEDPASLARQWVTELDRAGVKKAALIASIPGDEASVDSAVSAFPDRFYGFYIVNPLTASQPKRVPCLFPAMHRYSLYDPAVIAYLDSVAELPDPIVFIHCGVLSVGVRKKLGLSSPFDLRFSNPIDVHGIALRFPQVRFIVPHFGAGYLREALMVADLCPNVYFDTSSSNGWMRYLDGELTLSKVYKQVLDVMGPKRLLFGTDSSFFPRGWHRAVFDVHVDSLRQLGVGASDAADILGRNLESLLG